MAISSVRPASSPCPRCNYLLKHFEGRIRFAYRHFPIEEVHPYALCAAEAAECAGAQGKFWEMHQVLFDNQPQLDRKHLHRYAEDLGLDMPRFRSEMDRRELSAAHPRADGSRTTRPLACNARLLRRPKSPGRLLVRRSGAVRCHRGGVDAIARSPRFRLSPPVQASSRLATLSLSQRPVRADEVTLYAAGVPAGDRSWCSAPPARSRPRHHSRHGLARPWPDASTSRSCLQQRGAAPRSCS